MLTSVKKPIRCKTFNPCAGLWWLMLLAMCLIVIMHSGSLNSTQEEGLQMVNTSLCETARLGFYSARPRLSEVFGLRVQDLDSKTALQKIRDCETFRTIQKMRLRDPWNLIKILWDLYILRGHSQPLRSWRCLWLSPQATLKLLMCSPGPGCIKIL